MKHIAIGIAVGLLVFFALMGVLAIKGYDLSAINEWPALASLVSIISGGFAGWATNLSLGCRK